MATSLFTPGVRRLERSASKRDQHDVDRAEPGRQLSAHRHGDDGRGGTATNSITIPVMRRAPITFEDVHFDFDMSTLRPDAIQILDRAVMTLQATPTLT
jgi:outer membrane protein OmpA-like peptidoglycan-associated protein